MNALREMERGLAGAGCHDESAGRTTGDNQQATAEPEVTEWLDVIRVRRHTGVRCGSRVAAK